MSNNITTVKLSEEDKKYLSRLLKEKQEVYDKELLELHDKLSVAHLFNSTKTILNVNKTMDELENAIELNYKLINKINK